MSDLPILIRPIRETDHALIIDSWVNSVRYSTPAFFWVPGGLFRSIYRSMIVRLIECKPELFYVLVNEEDEDQIFGWVCADMSATHFVFVKKEFRREGLASKLLGSRHRGCGSRHCWVFTHWTRDCERIHDVLYEPSLFRELINGIEQNRRDSGIHPREQECEVVGSGIAPHDKHAREGSSDVEGGRDRQAESEAVGMVS